MPEGEGGSSRDNKNGDDYLGSSVEVEWGGCVGLCGREGGGQQMISTNIKRKQTSTMTLRLYSFQHPSIPDRK